MRLVELHHARPGVLLHRGLVALLAVLVEVVRAPVFGAEPLLRVDDEDVVEVRGADPGGPEACDAK